MISGYVNNSEDGRDSGFRVLQKRFTLSVLADYARAVLDGSSALEQKRSAGH